MIKGSQVISQTQRINNSATTVKQAQPPRAKAFYCDPGNLACSPSRQQNECKESLCFIQSVESILPIIRTSAVPAGKY